MIKKRRLKRKSAVRLHKVKNFSILGPCRNLWKSWCIRGDKTRVTHGEVVVIFKSRLIPDGFKTRARALWNIFIQWLLLFFCIGKCRVPTSVLCRCNQQSFSEFHLLHRALVLIGDSHLSFFRIFWRFAPLLKETPVKSRVDTKIDITSAIQWTTKNDVLVSIFW